jgi:hypothetical protein
MYMIYEQIDNEVRKATSNFEKINSFHEGYAIIKEEIEEFWDEVKKYPKNFEPEKMKKELIQVAAMCVRIIDDLNLSNESFIDTRQQKNFKETEGD